MGRWGKSVVGEERVVVAREVVKESVVGGVCRATETRPKT